MRKYAIYIIIILVLAVVHLFIFTKSIGLNYDMAKIKAQYDKAYKENRELNFKLAKGESLDNIETAAKTKLGMVYPDTMEYIIVSREGH